MVEYMILKLIANAEDDGSGTIEYDMVSYSSAISDCEKGQQKSGAHCNTPGCCNGAGRGPRAPSAHIKPKSVKGMLAGTNAITHAKVKRTKKFVLTGEELQETIDEADH
mgnify:CR=1 FL=1